MFVKTENQRPVIALLAYVSVAVFCFIADPTAYGQAVPGYCVAPYKINWPAANPVWSLCWTPPDSSSGVDGSGLELRHVFYKGKRVFWQAHVPVLNVIYDQPSGFCGPTYRDWQRELVPFEANNGIQPVEFNSKNGLSRSWRVMDNVTGRGYSIVPGAGDGVADAWAVADLWGLHYHFNEIDDGGAAGGPNGDAAQMNKYLNGENIN